MFKPKAAIFDLDGLLIDTERPFNKFLSIASEKKGYKTAEDIFSLCIGTDDKETIKILQSHLGKDYPYSIIKAEAIKLMDEQWEKEGIAKRPGALNLLNFLRTKKIPCALATSTYRERGNRKLTLSGIKSYFDVLTFGDEIENGKPAPDIFLLAAKRLNFGTEHIVGFEDSPAGLKALNAALIKSVFVEDTAKPSDEVMASVYRQYDVLDEAIELFL